MAPTINIVMLAVVGVLCIVVPFTLLFIVRKQSKYVIGAFLAGMISFYIPQMLIRIPLMQLVLPKMIWYTRLAQNSLIGYALFLGLTAALFETVGRYFTIKYVLRDRLGYYSGISHGIGHGGIEMIVLIGINYIAYTFFALQINAGTFDAKIAEAATQSQLAANQLTMLKSIIIDTPKYGFLVALAERLMTAMVHIGLSLLVMEGVIKKQGIKFSGIAIIIHSTLDSIAVIIGSKQVTEYLTSLTGIEELSTLLAEVFILLIAVGLGIYVFGSKNRFKTMGCLHPKIEDEELIESDY